MATLNSLTKFSLAITATTALGFLAPSANALSLTASSSGTWSNPVGGSDVKYQELTTNTLFTTTTTLTTTGKKNDTFVKRSTNEVITEVTEVTTVTKDVKTGKTSTKSTTSLPNLVSDTTKSQIVYNADNSKNGSRINNTSVTSSTTKTEAIENQVRWGEGKNGQSGLGFEGVSGLNLDLNEIFEIGTLRHYNNAINAGTAASKVNLGLNLNFSGIGAQTFNFSFNIDETPNVGKVSDCPYYSTAICSDKITFSTPKNVNTFSIADVEYTLQIVGFSQSPNGTPVKDFISQEGGSNSASLYAKITTAPPKRVPESSSGLSLVAFGALAAGSMLNQRQKLKATAKV
ncbi:choice-of-anchor K domain-containing protein [Calothrix sp. FACHB-1219]|uniref:choice-of-anchor K domain-containing protein n=1 Tax=unclassified Calothrix TaxID=2619626 RepID=UPI00168459EB|nr:MULTISPECIES: choice-of-anchor K domain-containing protein [unclassified Calothrix]MBD2205225.1 choice-of-anchor K domain-containing protein [Calothrix sp. FACHB-168]MBD2216631.1 choice-of-anchor K domain-containing protein [Calothrix sp. FACHB-1219]